MTPARPRPRALLAVALLSVAALGAPATAPAQTDNEEITPVGYTFCGWRDLADGGWHDEPEPGAYTVLFARGMTCSTARRNWSRLRFRQTGGPVLAGYRCAKIGQGEESFDIRCLRKGSRTVAFRFKAGA